MRTASYDPSRSKKKSRSPKPRPKTLPVNRDPGSRSSLTAESPTKNPASGTPEATPLDLGDPSLTEGASVEDQTSLGVAEVSTPAHIAHTELLTPVANTSQPLTSPSIDYVNSQGVRFIPSEEFVDDAQRVHIPYGLPCVRELLRFLISLINPLERQNTDAMTFVGLRYPSHNLFPIYIFLL